MTDKVYSCAYRLEHYTGWNGTGTPIYNKIDTTYLDSNGLNSISLYSQSTSNLYNSQICWQDVTLDSSDTIWVKFQISLMQTNYETYEGSLITILDKTTNKGISFRIVWSSLGSIYLLIYESTYNSSTHVALGSQLLSTSTSIPANKVVPFDLEITRSTGKFNLYFTNTSGVSNLLYQGTDANMKLSTSIALLFGIYLESSNTNNLSTLLYYSYVTNFSTITSYLDYEVAIGTGTYSQFSGTKTSFVTYPVSYTTTNGLYSTGPNQTETFVVPSNMTVSNPLIYPAFVVNSCPVVSDVSTNTDILNFATYDGTTLKNYGTNFTPITSGSSYMSIIDTNPITDEQWTLNQFNSYEFGITRIS